ncbi:uncharacterized protein KNAG_0I02680 [Huiozyma naganishii CBS 8797]|uniref:Uncharacterized protein n=1 Tax=Huiozyma naganishii (strain ATCC MYA-139 / BCRC 22969 / CBS 8797 / KCTC 17520 / NBRC 10181 / NCYC 3082 / Yp74L-3) TaxID=1071383 RepID=J7RQJ4_HUIN7|nr:hypothetical protein KNAG_0I02680 [Kazachstania naganishii CBS 8797]CCK72053.1 hypothetical protein KNAG_0I02680 [Kazachstania naganishii CBS 8797]
MLYLTVAAELSENIVKVSTKNSETDPAEFCFDLVCTSCREMHDSPVTINSFEKHDMSGSRGEASFTLKCKFCQNECSINLSPFEDALYAQPQENKDKRKKHGLGKVALNEAVILQLDCRGCDLKVFHFDNLIFLVELASGKIMECQFEQGEDEWYDYDDDANEEVSITEFKYQFVKGK